MKSHPQDRTETLQQQANRIRQQVIRLVARRGQGYVQQGLGAADIFTAIYLNEMNIHAGYFSDIGRDRCILSTAHNSAVFHATLAEAGLLDSNRLDTYCDDGSELEVNVSERLGDSVEATCGSLGQGLSVAVGMALSAKKKALHGRYFVILGDGEMQEGQTWEAAMSAASFGLDNICLVVDMNRMQVEGDTDQVIKMEPVADKWRAFGWEVCEVDGNNMEGLLRSFSRARNNTEKPFAVIAHTVAGKGVPFLEGQLSHNMVLDATTANDALKVLEEAS
ncbi:transketolase [Aliamphritea hakodatensis]|uniref:transketolase n=1 Tax=Aliamphritea hakodatensis TaxID=2895352 RepID=UPI0022FD464C|nr:transketolase [Aliamphritea hakodatensis]